MAEPEATIYRKFDKRILIIGFGSIGQAILPLLFRHLAITPAQVSVMTKSTNAKKIAKAYRISLELITLTKENYQILLTERLHAGDFLLNLSVDVSSLDLIQFCAQRGALYLDTC